MKKINRIKQWFIPIAVVLLSAACQKEIVNYNDGYDDGLTPNGVPVIDKITPVNDPGTILESASLAEMIAIHGENLSQVTSIRFNDVEADLKEVFAVNSRIVLPVPRKFPLEVDNKLTVTTTLGTASAEFVISVPKLQVTGLYNEFAAPGDTVRLMGNNFDLYDITEEKGVVELNGQKIPILEATATYLELEIPENTPDNSLISISSPSVTEPVTASFRHWGQSMANYSEGTWGDTGKYLTDGTKAGDPKPLLGVAQFTRVAGTFDAWSWNVPFGGGFNLEDEDIIAHPENYLFKMEINTKSNKSLSIGNIIIQNYTWNPGNGGIAFNTYGEWNTISFELTTVMTLKPNDWNSYSIVFQPTEEIDADFSFANMRIVKK